MTTRLLRLSAFLFLMGVSGVLACAGAGGEGGGCGGMGGQGAGGSSSCGAGTRWNGQKKQCEAMPK